MCFQAEQFNGTHKTKLAVDPKTDKVIVKCVECNAENHHKVDFDKHPEVQGDERLAALENFIEGLLKTGAIGEPDPAWLGASQIAA